MSRLIQTTWVGSELVPGHPGQVKVGSDYLGRARVPGQATVSSRSFGSSGLVSCHSTRSD